MRRFDFSSLPVLSESILSVVYREIRDVYFGLPSHPRWFLMRKLARFESLRALVNYLRRHSTPPDGSDNVSRNENTIFHGTDIDHVTGCLRQDGIYIGLNLPKDRVEKIIQFAKSTPCYGDGKPHFGFYYHEKDIVSKKLGIKFSAAYYYNTSSCESIQEIIEDPVLLNIARRYLGGTPVHQGTNLRWSFRKNSSEFEKYKFNQTFHYDVDDYCAMKFFFYLTDVGIDDGPHMYISGSHKMKKFFYKIIRGIYNEKNVYNFYKPENIKHICGNSGYGFVEDSFILHKGLSPVKNDRLILIIEYALRDYNMQHDHMEASRLKCALRQV